MSAQVPTSKGPTSKALPTPKSQSRVAEGKSRTEMDTIFQDVWYALRQFGRRPGFAAVAVLSLGHGDRREQPDLWPCRRSGAAPLPLPRSRSPRRGWCRIPAHVGRHQLRRGPLAGGIRGHTRHQLLRVGRRVRSREPQHLRWRRSRAGLHCTPARRSLPRDRHAAAAWPRLHARRNSCPAEPPVAIISNRLWHTPVRRRSRHRRPQRSHRRSVDAPSSA